MPSIKRQKALPVGAEDYRYHEAKQSQAYLKADDTQQFEIMREKWSALNWDVMHTAHEAARAVYRGEKKAAELSPLIIAAGIGFDKLYSKRPASVQPLSFPPPLLAMVRKGLELANRTRESPQPVVTPKQKPVMDHIPETEISQNANETPVSDTPEQLT